MTAYSGQSAELMLRDALGASVGSVVGSSGVVARREQKIWPEYTTVSPGKWRSVPARLVQDPGEGVGKRFRLRLVGFELVEVRTSGWPTASRAYETADICK